MSKKASNSKRNNNVKKKSTSTYKPKKKYVPKGTTKPRASTKTKENNFSFSDEQPVEIVIPYNDELSTVKLAEEVIPYNDELSTIIDENEVIEEMVEYYNEEVIPHNDELSTIIDENEVIEEMVEYYNEEIEKEDTESLNKKISEDKIKESNEQDVEVLFPSQEADQSITNSKTPTGAFIITGIILVIGLSILVVYLLYKAFSVEDIKNIRYNEKSNITYIINKTDGSSIIGDSSSNTNIIPGEITDVHINTNYNYETNIQSNLSFTYYYLARLRIVDEETNEELYQKKYKLSDKNKKEIIEKNDYSLSTSIELDYQDFLSKSNKKISKYENAKSFVDIYLIIEVKSLDSNDYFLSLYREPFIRLSLSGDNINPEITNLMIEDRVYNKPKVVISKPIRLIEGIILAVLTMIVLVSTIQLVYDNKKE